MQLPGETDLGDIFHPHILLRDVAFLSVHCAPQFDNPIINCYHHRCNLLKLRVVFVWGIYPLRHIKLHIEEGTMSTRGKLFFAFLIALMLFTSVGTAIVALAAGPGEVNFDGWALCPRMTERNPTQARLLIYNTDTTPEEALNEPAGAVGMIKFDGNLFGGSFSLSGQADYTVAMISGNVRVANTVRLYTTTDVARPDDFCSGPSIGGVEAAPTKPTEPTQPSVPIAAASKKEPSAQPTWPQPLSRLAYRQRLRSPRRPAKSAPARRLF
jgi:hypothetical protein